MIAVGVELFGPWFGRGLFDSLAGVVGAGACAHGGRVRRFSVQLMRTDAPPRKPHLPRDTYDLGLWVLSLGQTGTAAPPRC